MFKIGHIKSKSFLRLSILYSNVLSNENGLLLHLQIVLMLYLKRVATYQNCKLLPDYKNIPLMP